MKKSTVVIWVVIILIIIASLLWWSMRSSPPAQPAAIPVTTQTAPVTQAPSPQVVLMTASSTKLGTFLTAANGRTLYTFKNDSPGTSTCYGACATRWPPYTTTSTSGVVGAKGVTGTVGTLTRADGTMQITYNNMPVYFYYLDKAVGDTKGNGVLKLWYVIKP
ncbi:MAG: COG4315 family predicted lipoprotein [Minisyncoccia bacterium]